MLNHKATVYEPCVVLRQEVVYSHHTARIDAFCKIEGGQGVHIGEFVHIASFCHVNIGGGITFIGNGAGMSSGAKIISGTNVPGLGRPCSAIAPGAVFSRSVVTIGEDAILFTNAVVLPGVEIGRNSVIGAGAVVTQNVPPNEVWAGIPARKIGMVRSALSEWEVAQMDSLFSSEVGGDDEC